MLIAGEASGDLLAAELVEALKPELLELQSQPTEDVQPLRTPLAPRFFGAGGPCMAAADVELAFDLTQHSVLGVSDVLKNLRKFRRLFHQLLRLAIERQPDVIIGVDYGGFNLHFARAVRHHTRQRGGWFGGWNPKLVQFVSPQVWASRPGRAGQMAQTHDLLLSIFPFEKEWYVRHAPKLRVEFVGHPMVGRFVSVGTSSTSSQTSLARIGDAVERIPTVLLLPGSRWDEVRRHWPVLTAALELLRRELPALRAKLVLPDDELARSARSLGVPPGLELQVGGVPSALTEADLAITKSGTITMECAFFGVPAVVFYKTSWPTYWVAKQLVTVNYAAMPNLLAGEELFPEFIQSAATPENIARAALALLRDDARRQTIRTKLAKVIASLGGPGAARRAAEAVVSLLP
jgi:lipid-A-disaccharide synthase